MKTRKQNNQKNICILVILYLCSRVTMRWATLKNDQNNFEDNRRKMSYCLRLIKMLKEDQLKFQSVSEKRMLLELLPKGLKEELLMHEIITPDEWYVLSGETFSIEYYKVEDRKNFPILTNESGGMRIGENVRYSDLWQLTQSAQNSMKHGISLSQIKRYGFKKYLCA